MRSIAELAARNNDEQLKALLTAQGITLTVNPPGTPAGGAETAGKKVEDGEPHPLLAGADPLPGLFWTGFQTVQLWRERETLSQAREKQQQLVDNSVKLRTQLDTLVAETQKLANAGNPNARLLVEERRKRGVSIKG